MSASGNRALERETDDALEGERDVTDPAIYNQEDLLDLASRKHATARDNTKRSYGLYTKQFQAYALLRGINVVELENAGNFVLLPSGERFANLAAGFIKYQYDQGKSASVIRQCRSAVIQLYNAYNLVCKEPPQPALGDVAVFKLEFETAIAALKGKGTRPGGQDPQANTAADPLTREELERLAEFMRTPDGHIALKWTAEKFARYRALILLLYFGIGRSDDSRLMYLCDLGKPVHLTGLGPCKAISLQIVLKGGKAQKNGQVAYVPYIRTKDIMICPIGGYGEQLWRRHTANRQPYPNPTKEEEWLKCPMFPSETDPAVEAAYQQQHRDITIIFKHLRISTSKVCHAFRPAAATHLDQAGVADTDILRAGRWASGALYNHYLTKSPLTAMLVLAGYETEQGLKQAFWAERFNAPITEPELEECKLWLYPWLTDLRSQVAVVQGNPRSYPAASISGPNNLAAVEMLARVAVEDSLELADRQPGNAMVQHLQQLRAWQSLRAAYLLAKANNELVETRPCRTEEAFAALAGQLDEISQQQQQLVASVPCGSQQQAGGLAFTAGGSLSHTLASQLQQLSPLPLASTDAAAALMPPPYGSGIASAGVPLYTAASQLQHLRPLPSASAGAATATPSLPLHGGGGVAAAGGLASHTAAWQLQQLFPASAGAATATPSPPLHGGRGVAAAGGLASHTAASQLQQLFPAY